jgi:hypothetical protein
MSDKVIARDWRWVKGGNCLWYDERPRFIVSYHKTDPGEIVICVNMAYLPTMMDIEASLVRAMAVSGIEGRIVNLRLDHWRGKTEAFWYADVVRPL